MLPGKEFCIYCLHLTAKKSLKQFIFYKLNALKFSVPVWPTTVALIRQNPDLHHGGEKQRYF
jgi:hypothetical protein